MHQFKNQYKIWIEKEWDPGSIRCLATITGYDLTLQIALYISATRHIPVWISTKDLRLIHRIPA